MPKRYTRKKMMETLETLDAQDGDVKATSVASGVPAITIRKWRDTLTSVERVHYYVEQNALTLSKELTNNTHTAPLNQRASALGMLIDRLLKLNDYIAEHRPSADDDNTVNIIYTEPDGSVWDTPPWERNPDVSAD